jgi:hypothetical protein
LPTLSRDDGAGLPCGSLASGWGTLDGAPRASVPSHTVSSSRRPSTAPGSAPLPPRSQPRARLAMNPSDAPCRAPRRPETRTACEEPEPLPPLTRQRDRLVWAQSAFHRQVPPSIRFRGLRVFMGTRHRCRGLATETRLPTRFRFPLLSRWKTRPIVDSGSSSLSAARGHTSPVDFCNRINPRARPANRSNPAHRTNGRPSVQLLVAGGYAGPKRCPLARPSSGAWPTEASRVRGPARATARAAHLPSQSLAEGASPQPTRLGHPFVASS